VSTPLSATVAVSCRRGARALAPFLATLANQVVDAGRVDLLVLAPRLDAAVAGLLDEWQRRRSIRGTVLCGPGRSPAAHNAALRDSRHDVVVFTDELCLLPPTWLVAHLDTLTGDEGAAAVGGPVGTYWPVGRPGWLGDALAAWFAGFDLGDEVLPFPTGLGPPGGNLAVRRQAALEAGGFTAGREVPVVGAPSLATVPLCARLRRNGAGIVYQPAAAVIVRVDADLLTRHALLRRAWAEGVMAPLADGSRDGTGRAGELGRAVAELRGVGTQWRMRRRDDPMAADLGLVKQLGTTVAHGARALKVAAGHVATQPLDR
jgi:hypothetical protein